MLGRGDYLDAARTAAAFVWDELRDSEGRLLRTWKDGEGKILGTLEDHAYVVEAFLVLYEATFDERWFRAAREHRRLDDRAASRDPERGRLLHDRDRRRGAHRPAQGRRRPPDPVGQLIGRVRPPPAGGSHRRARLRRARAVRLPPLRASRRAPPARRGPPPARDRLSTSPRSRRSPSWGTTWTSWLRSCARSSGLTSSSPAGRRAQTLPS